MNQNKYKIYFITGNTSKYQEISGYIPNLKQLDIENLPEIQSLDIQEVIKAKIRYAGEHLNYNNHILLVEDTGLYLNALNGFPGPLIKFMLESIGNEGIYKICASFDNYGSYATTVFGMYHPSENKIRYYSSTIEGKITAPTGNYGFGWDTIFIPENLNRTFAEMKSTEEKNKHSMRYMALDKLLKNEFSKNLKVDQIKE